MYKYIMELKNIRAPDLDNITITIQKEISEFIIMPLAYIINKCFTEGICPQYFKIAVIIPLFKSGD